MKPLKTYSIYKNGQSEYWKPIGWNIKEQLNVALNNDIDFLINKNWKAILNPTTLFKLRLINVLNFWIENELDDKINNLICKIAGDDWVNDIDFNKFLTLWKDDLNWYDDTKKLLAELFTKEDINLIIDLLAATSIRSSIRANSNFFFKALRDWEKWNEFKNYSIQNIIPQLNLLRSGEELSWRKVRNFSQAIKWNPDAIALDTHLATLFGINKTYKRDGDNFATEWVKDPWYAQIHYLIIKKAKEIWLQPKQLVAMLWRWYKVSKWENKTRYDDDMRYYYNLLYKN